MRGIVQTYFKPYSKQVNIVRPPVRTSLFWEKTRIAHNLFKSFHSAPHPAQYAPPSPDFKIFHYKYTTSMWEGFLFCPLPSFAHLCAQNPPSPTGKANKKLSTEKINRRKLFVCLLICFSLINRRFAVGTFYCSNFCTIQPRHPFLNIFPLRHSSIKHHAC